MTFQSLGTPLWGDKSSLQGFTPKEDSISLFLHKLRALLRRSYAVAMVTMPTHLIQVRNLRLVLTEHISKTCNVYRMKALRSSCKGSVMESLV